MKINQKKARFLLINIILAELIIISFLLFSSFSNTFSTFSTFLTIAYEESGIKCCIEPGLEIENYESLLQEIEDKRINLGRLYALASSKEEKKRIIEEARQTIVDSVCLNLAAYWYGTPWNFNGTTEVPQKGSIACGYFVSTLLEDAGFSIDRISLSQQASENIIKSLTSEDYIQRFSNTSIEEFINSVKQTGRGLYIAGLDIHTGFLYYDSENVYFIHASYSGKKCVVWEEALKSNILKSSKYRVIGQISADNDLLIKWLTGKKIATYKP